MITKNTRFRLNLEPKVSHWNDLSDGYLRFFNKYKHGGQINRSDIIDVVKTHSNSYEIYFSTHDYLLIFEKGGPQKDELLIINNDTDFLNNFK